MLMLLKLIRVDTNYCIISCKKFSGLVTCSKLKNYNNNTGGA